MPTMSDDDSGFAAHLANLLRELNAAKRELDGAEAASIFSDAQGQAAGDNIARLRQKVADAQAAYDRAKAER